MVGTRFLSTTVAWIGIVSVGVTGNAQSSLLRRFRAVDLSYTFDENVEHGAESEEPPVNTTNVDDIDDFWYAV